MNQRQLGQQPQQLQQQVQQQGQQLQQLQQQVAELQQQNGQILESLNNVNETLVRVNARLASIEIAENLLPLRLYNASVSYDNPLRYPPAVVIEDPIPRTKAALLDLTIAQCIEVAAILGRPALEAGTTVARRRLQISDYLGCAM